MAMPEPMVLGAIPFICIMVMRQVTVVMVFGVNMVLAAAAAAAVAAATVAVILMAAPVVAVAPVVAAVLVLLVVFRVAALLRPIYGIPAQFSLIPFSNPALVVMAATVV